MFTSLKELKKKKKVRGLNLVELEIKEGTLLLILPKEEGS